jgi:hypothetical protein
MIHEYNQMTGVEKKETPTSNHRENRSLSFIRPSGRPTGWDMTAPSSLSPIRRKLIEGDFLPSGRPNRRGPSAGDSHRYHPILHTYVVLLIGYQALSSSTSEHSPILKYRLSRHEGSESCIFDGGDCQ